MYTNQFTRFGIAILVLMGGCQKPLEQQQTSNAITYQYVRGIFDLLDAKDIEGYGALLADDAELYFGNSPVVKGRAAIVEGQRAFLSSIAKMEHAFDEEHVWIKEGSFVMSGHVTYTRLDGSTLTVPVSDSYFIEDNKVKQAFIYIDANTLFSPN